MSEGPLGLPQVLAFLLAAWAVIGNDSLQTLGPFLAANRGRIPRFLQALFLCAVLCAVLLLGWWRGGGDASWGRLEQIPLPNRLGWGLLLPPLAVLLLTRWGAPVSTSFLVLTAIRPASLPDLLQRSLLGYGLALLVALLTYGAAMLLRQRASAAAEQSAEQPGEPRQATSPQPDPQSQSGKAPQTEVPQIAPPPAAAAGGGSLAAALGLQWAATGWLWSQWLIQDLANIYVVLPRQLDAGAMALTLLVLCTGVALLLCGDGGAIQTIVQRKSGLEDPGANAALSLLYGLVLAVLAAISRQPLSTTWVFLGLLAGRELALRLAPPPQPMLAVARELGRDLALAALGLAVSLVVALMMQLPGAIG